MLQNQHFFNVKLGHSKFIFVFQPLVHESISKNNILLYSYIQLSCRPLSTASKMLGKTAITFTAYVCHEICKSKELHISRVTDKTWLIYESLVFNIQIHNLSSGPHITCFSAVVAKKRKSFE